MAIYEQALVTLTELKELLGISGTGEDGRWQHLINGGSRAIVMRCDRRLVKPSSDETIYTQAAGENNKELLLPTWPVAVTSVYEDDDRDFGSETEVTATQRWVDTARGKIIKVSGTWSTTPGAIKVIFSGGYDSAAIPEDLKLACALLAKWLRARTTAPGAKRARAGLLEIDYAALPTKEGWPPEVEILIRSHIRAEAR